MRSALRLVWAIDVRHLAGHRARLALATLGIAAGVALAVSVSALGTSIGASLEAIARASAADADIEVRPTTTAGLPPAAVDRIARLDGVEAVGGTVETYTRIRANGEGVRVLLLGLDAGILEMAPEAVDADTFRTADPFGLMVPLPLAEQLGIEVGDALEVATPQGWKPIAVGTILDQEATDRAQVVVGAVGVVQELLGRPGRFDAIYVQAPDTEATIPVVQEAVGPSGRAGTLAVQEDQVRDIVDSTTNSLNAASVVALFVGAFLVYNTMSMTAVERIGEAALLRAIGARRRQVFSLFLAEGAFLGVIGSGVGLGGGVVLAQALMTQRGGPLETLLPVDITQLSFSPIRLAVAGAGGVIAALAAAYLPARRVSRQDPAPALGPAGAFEDPTETPRTAFNVVGVLLLLVGVGVTFVPGPERGTGRLMAGLVFTLGGVALLVRTVVPVLARLMLSRASSERSRLPGVARLAAGEVLRSPGRTAFTAGAVLLALSLVVGFGIVQSSFSRTFTLTFDEIVRADLYVRSATWRPLGSDVPLDDDLEERIEAIEGVAIAYPFRVVRSTVDEDAVLVLSYDFDEYAQLPGLSPEWRTEVERQARLLAGDRTILVSPSVPQKLGPGIGDDIELPTPQGPVSFEIVGTLNDPAAVIPELYVDHDEITQLWGAGGADAFPVGIEPGADRDEVQARIEAALGPRYGIEVDTREEYLGRINALVQGTLQLISSVQLVALVVAALGLANTLLISTLERRRDLGVLRAVGMTRGQVRRMVGMEALAIGALGVILAWGLGTAIGLGMHQLIQIQVGTDVQLVIPPSVYLVAGGLGMIASVLAAIYPAHRASRVDVVEALQYE